MSNSYKLDIIFYVPGMEFDGNSLSTKALGGSETAALCMARELAKIGHHVKVFNNIKKPGKFNEVDYFPLSFFNSYALYTQSDVIVSERVPQIFTLPMKSKLNILWNHDLAVKSQRQAFRGSLWGIDEVFGLSDFHIKQMSETYAVPKSLFWKTRNGIDPWLFEKARQKPIARHPKRLIYTARPERGMDILLHAIMPKLWEKDPNIELHLAGYSFTTKEMLPFYESLQQKAKDYMAMGRKVKWLGELTKAQLYKEYMAASLYVYPSAFEEISCITAMEAMACGLPFVGFVCGALKETLHENASVLLKGRALSAGSQQDFVDKVLDLLNHKKGILIQSMGEAGKAYATKLSWGGIAQEWTEHFYELFKERTGHRNAMETQFYKNEDIVALSQIGNDSTSMRFNIAKKYPFIDKPELATEHYIAQGKDFVEKLEKVGTEIKTELGVTMRHKVVREIVGKAKPKTILDFAGGVGNEAIQFVNDLGCEVHTVNISPEEQDYGKRFAKKLCKHPDKIKWLTPNDTIIKPIRPIDTVEGTHDPIEYDVVFAGEYLEHCLHPEEIIDELEMKCKEGGLMVFTVPFGPWGDVPEARTQYRGHLWNFEQEDLRNLFGKKKTLSIKVVGGPANPYTKESLGWHVISYKNNKADQHKTGKVDLSRKVAIQSPRQTLSVCMIIGGDQEGLLHRCLKSIHFIADEIIIADCGMSEICKGILALPDYADKIRIIDGLDPNKHGFEEARNVSIREVKCDWILWIDSDEELLLSENIFKYLRHNFYNGYSIRQHHFSARPTNAFKCDVPIRLFRNHKAIRFFGVVHEHPETELNKSVGESTIISDLEIAHDGYLTEETRRKRFERNIILIKRDREKYPERILGKFLWLRDEIHLARYELERNKRQLTPQIRAWLEDVIITYRKEFLGKPNLMGDDGLNFYSEAVRTLGRGIEYDMSLVLNWRGKPMEGGTVIKHHFDTKEDFLTFTEAKLKALTEPIEGPYIQ